MSNSNLRCRLARSRLRSVFASTLLLVACGSDDEPRTSQLDGGAGPVGLLDAGTASSGSDAAASAPAVPPVYVAASWVSTDDTANTYISVLDSVDREGQLDFAQALEIGGYGDVWVSNGKVFVADGESPTITRYDVVDGKLVSDKVISFGNYGLKQAAFYDNEFLSPTKAYAIDSAQQQYIVWNPSTMEIVKTVPWPTLTFAPGFEPFQSYTDRGGVVVGKYFFHGIYASEAGEFIKFGDKSIIGIYDIETDALVKTLEVPCPMMDVMTLAGDGKLYLSGWSYMPLSKLAGYTAKNCAARIDVATQTLDPTWSLDFPAITGGKEGSAIRAATPTEGIFAVFHGTGIPVTPDIDMWDLDKGESDWELYSLDFATNAVKPTGVKFGDGSYYETHLGDRYFVFLGDMNDTQVYERTAGGYVKKFRARGWMSRLLQVR